LATCFNDIFLNRGCLLHRHRLLWRQSALAPAGSNPTVWIATIRVHGERLALDDLHPVQNLPGSGDAFAKLVNWLGGVKFAATAIDAPFSIPAIHIPQGSHAELVRRAG
jgi:hypothetical protein